MNRRKEINKIVKDSIAESLFFLMRTKTFSDITVTEIVKKAGVARASFYRNFAYKEDVIGYYLVEVMKRYKDQFFRSESDYGEMILETMHFALDYREELESLFKAGLSQLFLSTINTYLLDKWNGKFEKETDKYFLFSYGGSIFNVICCWIESGAKENPEEIAEVILNAERIFRARV